MLKDFLLIHNADKNWGVGVDEGKHIDLSRP
jgi:hypothetical protein